MLYCLISDPTSTFYTLPHCSRYPFPHLFIAKIHPPSFPIRPIKSAENELHTTSKLNRIVPVYLDPKITSQPQQISLSSAFFPSQGGYPFSILRPSSTLQPKISFFHFIGPLLADHLRPIPSLKHHRQKGSFDRLGEGDLKPFVD